MKLLRNISALDVIPTVFYVYFVLRAWLAPESEGAYWSRWVFSGLLLVTLLAVVSARGEIIGHGPTRGMIYRLGLFGPFLVTYFALGTLLPALQLDMRDMALWDIDKALFGVSPALALQVFNRIPVNEWFSLFYESYFLVLACMLIPGLIWGRGRYLEELTLGAMWVAAIGHILYSLVPGVGPFAVANFDHPIRGAFFWRLVSATVEIGGSKIDIFPSLHTAFPTFFALHLFGFRKSRGLRFAWMGVGFIAANIVVATMLLRWHWAIDVIAGLALAFSARYFAHCIGRYERNRRAPQDPSRQPLWEPLTWQRGHADDLK